MLLGLGGLGVHACMDFPLHVPAIALLAAAWTVPRLSAALTLLTQAEIEGKAGNVPG